MKKREKKSLNCLEKRKLNLLVNQSKMRKMKNKKMRMMNLLMRENSIRTLKTKEMQL